MRRPELTDASAIHEMCAQQAVSRHTLRIPHPYPEGEAEKYIQRALEKIDSGAGITMVIVLDDAVIGTIAVSFDPEHGRAELGYLVDPAYWGRGLATEAVCCFAQWVIKERGVNRLGASVAPENPASGRVLEKAGSTPEGHLRDHYRVRGEYVDSVIYSLLRRDIHTD